MDRQFQPPAYPAPAIPHTRLNEFATKMKIGLIAMSGIRVRTAELAALGVTLPGFVRRGKVVASLPSLGLLTIAGMTCGNDSGASRGRISRD
jgi:hypothetical protein